MVLMHIFRASGANDNRSNPSDYDSADDFEPPKQLPKTSQVGIVTPIFKSVKSLSDIKGKISLQICDVLPSNANNVNCVINVSDTQFWIPITLDKGFFEKSYISIRSILLTKYTKYFLSKFMFKCNIYDFPIIHRNIMRELKRGKLKSMIL